MKSSSVLRIILFVSFSLAVIAAPVFPVWFADAVAKTGQSYRDAVSFATNDLGVAKSLHKILLQEPADNVKARQARILLARVKNPEVFASLADELQNWRESENSSTPRGGRPGFLSGVLLQFTRSGPERKDIEEYVRDEDGRIVFEPNTLSKGKGSLRGMRAKHIRIEKYTDTEIEAGIARNAAARQAVLEHLLKFLHEGDAYEQSEMVRLVMRLWGRSREHWAIEYPVVDHVEDADPLAESIVQDRTVSTLARMTAAFYLADSKPKDVQGFMLNVVANPQSEVSSNGQEYEQVVHDALYYLGTYADASVLDALRRQTNGPQWKNEKVAGTVRAIESRLVRERSK